MGLGVKIGIVGFGLLVGVAAYEAYTQQGDPPDVVFAQNAVAHDLAQKLVDSLPRDAHWSRVSIDEAKTAVYRLTLYFPAGKDAAPDVEADTRAVAQGMLLQLTMASHHPSDERTVIAVTARQDPGGGLLGAAQFDPAKDHVLFERPNP